MSRPLVFLIAASAVLVGTADAASPQRPTHVRVWGFTRPDPMVFNDRDVAIGRISGSALPPAGTPILSSSGVTVAVRHDGMIQRFDADEVYVTRPLRPVEATGAAESRPRVRSREADADDSPLGRNHRLPTCPGDPRCS